MESMQIDGGDSGGAGSFPSSQFRAINETDRQSLRSKVARAAEFLHEQGPISTFIHTNPLHNLEHLPFEQAVATAERMLGGRGYLPNEEFRQLYRQGRITDRDLSEALASYLPQEESEGILIGTDRLIRFQDVARLHLLHGIEPLDPAHLSWKIHREGATKRLRPDLPAETKTSLLTKAAAELRLSLERVGREWTLAEWVHIHCAVDVPGRLRRQLLVEFGPENKKAEGTSVPQRPDTSTSLNIDHWLKTLEIPDERREGYRRCINRHLYNIGLFSTALQHSLQIRWLQLECEILRDIVPRHLGFRGTFSGILNGCERNLEAYATTSLWYASLSARGLDDPLSPSDPDTLLESDCLASRREALYRRIMAVEREGGAPLPLTAQIRTAIEQELDAVSHQRQRQRLILTELFNQHRFDRASHTVSPLTLTNEAQDTLRRLRHSYTSSPTGLVRLWGELRVRGGFHWKTWKEVCDRSLFLPPSVGAEEERRWKDYFHSQVRVRITETVRTAIEQEYAIPRSAPHSEERRAKILSGLTDQGLTLDAWDALQEDIRDWGPSLLSASSSDLETDLCQTIRKGLRETELTRSAYDALQRLIAHRDRTQACRHLLEDLHHFDPRERLVKHSREDLTATMERVGHSLTVSELLYDITGVDITECVNRYMIKWCGAFLDQGIAGWSMPYRQLGFFKAWKRLAADELALGLGDVDDWHDAIRNLPDRPEDCLIYTLRSLQIPEQHYTPYLSRRLLKLSGWAALVKWREHHPLHFKQVQEHIDLVEYLAVRLFCEAMLIKQACRKIWGLEGTIPKLHDLHRDHPFEFYLRREFFRGGLPDYLESRCRDLLRANPQSDRARWIRTAEMVWKYRQATAIGRDPLSTACQHAWRLFQLSQLLGLSAGELRKLSPAEADRLLSMLDKLPSTSHGPIWQTAYEGHYQRELLDRLTQRSRESFPPQERPHAQLVFCIDEREESIRRHIESLSPHYETFGTAGFFGVVMNYSALGDHKVTPLCPIVVTPTHTVLEEPAPQQQSQWERIARRKRWLAFLDHLFVALKKNFLTSYFVIDLAASVMAVVLIGKTLLPRRFSRLLNRLHQLITQPPPTRLTVDEVPAESPSALRKQGHNLSQAVGFSLDHQIGLVESQLRLIGLTKTFARLVVLFGHGSTSQNNPHESAYDCGACGGKHGGPNARALATIANKPDIRTALRARGIDIPADTVFIGAQHNTASDDIVFFDTECIPVSHHDEFSRLVQDLDHARALNAKERCRLLPLAPANVQPLRALRHVQRRSVDFSQVYAEWGHATNASVLVGRRSLSRGLNLDRRTFLQSYNAFDDPDGVILERILTAIGPVCAGIGLEYYFSRVDNGRYGSGTKVLHNVSGLVGVMAGAHGDLRTGLPFQMVWLHEPMRLTFVIEGRPALVTSIVQRHKNLRHLFDNQWLHLIVLDIHTGQFVRYEPVGNWITFPATSYAFALR